MAATDPWKIRSRADLCAHSEKPFEEGQRIFTAIFPDTESDGYVRKDFDADLWPTIVDELKPFSFWGSTYEPPAQDAGEVVEKEGAESLLRRLIEENEPHTENARYVLAVMLERKKVLRPTDEQEEEAGDGAVDESETEVPKFLFYEHAASGEAFMIRDPKLRLDQVESVQEEVAELLTGTEKPPEQEAAADDSASAGPDKSVVDSPDEPEVADPASPTFVVPAKRSPISVPKGQRKGRRLSKGAARRARLDKRAKKTAKKARRREIIRPQHSCGSADCLVC